MKILRLTAYPGGRVLWVNFVHVTLFYAKTGPKEQIYTVLEIIDGNTIEVFEIPEVIQNMLESK